MRRVGWLSSRGCRLLRGGEEVRMGTSSTEVGEVFALMSCSAPGFQLSWKGAATWRVYLFFSLFSFGFCALGYWASRDTILE